MRVIAYKDGTTEKVRMEVTKVDKKKLDAATFTPPPSYKVVDINQAMQGLMSGKYSGEPGRPGAKH